MLAVIIFFLAHWYLSLFTQTFFHHRYSAHRMFTMSPFWEKVFFILSIIFQGASYLSPRAYGVLHRMHHAFADTEKDPHSPKFSKGLMDMMWKTKHIYNAILRHQHNTEDRFLKNLPEWDSADRVGDYWPIRIMWGVLYSMFYIFVAPPWYMYFLLPVHYFMGPIHGAIINYFAHLIGYVSHKLEDTSKNLLFFDFLMLGESYHNNHHKHSSNPNFGQRWHEFDPIYPIIRIFDWIRIIRLRTA